MPRKVTPFAYVAAAVLACTGCAEGKTGPPVEKEDAGVEPDPDVGAGDDATNEDTSASDADVQPDAADDAGPSAPPPEFLYPSSGGGITSSSNYELRVSVGAPASRGTTSDDEHRLQVAPVSP